MKVNGITPNIAVSDTSSRKFYTEFLGLVPRFDLGWVTNLSAADDPSVDLQLVTHDETAPVDSAISIHVSDVEEAYEQAKSRGYEIVHEFTVEEWGVKRFFVRAPDGTVVNIVGHA